MEEILILGVVISFGAFFFIIIMVCCLRFLAYLKDEDRKHLCFRRKQAEARRRRRVQLPIFNEGIFTRSDSTDSYVAAPDEALTELSLCQNYVYQDSCSTGMRMIADLPIAIAYTSQTARINARSRLQSAVYTSYCPPSPVFHGESIILNEVVREQHDEPPPPDYNQAQRLVEAERQEIEPPPPSYNECMEMQNIQLHM